MLKLDALRNKNNFDDRVMEAVGAQLEALSEPGDPPRPGAGTPRLAPRFKLAIGCAAR